MSSAVAEKANQRAMDLKKEEPVAPVNNFGTIGTISGIEPGDISMPYMYVVQSNSKNAQMEDGSKAKPGEFFHNTKKESYKEIKVLLAFAKKGKATKKDIKTGEETQVPAYRAVMLDVNSKESPFIMTFKGYNLWSGWKPYMSKLSAEGISNLDNVVVMTTVEQDTSYGSVVHVVNMEIGDKTTKEEKSLMADMVNRFSGVLNGKEEEEDVSGDEDISDLLKSIDGEVA